LKRKRGGFPLNNQNKLSRQKVDKSFYSPLFCPGEIYRFPFLILETGIAELETAQSSYPKLSEFLTFKEYYLSNTDRTQLSTGTKAQNNLPST
jgi:hypothetical protein